MAQAGQNCHEIAVVCGLQCDPGVQGISISAEQRSCCLAALPLHNSTNGTFFKGQLLIARNSFPKSAPKTQTIPLKLFNEKIIS